MSLSVGRDNFDYEFDIERGHDMIEDVENSAGREATWSDDGNIRSFNVAPPSETQDGAAHIDMLTEGRFLEPCDTSPGTPEFFFKPFFPDYIDDSRGSETGANWYVHWRANDEIKAGYSAAKLVGELDCSSQPLEKFGLSTFEARELQEERPDTYTFRIAGIAPDQSVDPDNYPRADFRNGYIEFSITQEDEMACESLSDLSEKQKRERIAETVDWGDALELTDHEAISQPDDTCYI